MSEYYIEEIARSMSHAMSANNNEKGWSWLGMEQKELLHMLEKQVLKLNTSIGDEESNDVQKRCVNIANYAMMIFNKDMIERTIVDSNKKRHYLTDRQAIVVNHMKEGGYLEIIALDLTCALRCIGGTSFSIPGRFVRSLHYKGYLEYRYGPGHRSEDSPVHGFVLTDKGKAVTKKPPKGFDRI